MNIEGSRAGKGCSFEGLLRSMCGDGMRNHSSGSSGGGSTACDIIVVVCRRTVSKPAH